MRRLSDTEYEIMEFAWSSPPPFTTAMIMQHIGEAREWKMQTAVTLINRLIDRGFIRAQKPSKGRERLFYPQVSREEYLQFETDSFVSHYHKNSIASLLGSIRRERLSQADLDELSAFVEHARREE